MSTDLLEHLLGKATGLLIISFTINIVLAVWLVKLNKKK
jgi:hypothetical protein